MDPNLERPKRGHLALKSSGKQKQQIFEPKIIISEIIIICSVVFYINTSFDNIQRLFAFLGSDSNVRLPSELHYDSICNFYFNNFNFIFCLFVYSSCTDINIIFQSTYGPQSPEFTL